MFANNKIGQKQLIVKIRNNLAVITLTMMLIQSTTWMIAAISVREMTMNIN